MNLRIFILLVFAMITGCAGLPDSRTEQIGTRQVEFVMNSRSGPVVVFENGLGGRMEWWNKVLPAIESDTSYFAYNRPGYGKSAPTDTPRDGLHVVEELRSSLLKLGLQPPYVLVGHSLGGLYMQLFARKYPNDVAALILVDSTHPKQLEGTGALEKQSFVVRNALKVLVTGTSKDELDLLSQTGDQVLSLPTLSAKPVFILSASEYKSDTSDVARFANEMREDIARLYPGSKQVWVESGHAIPLEKPDAVVGAIRSALTEANRVR